MSNVQYEKITGSINNLRKAYKEERDKAVKNLIESVAEIELSTHAMATRNEQDYLYLNIIKMHLDSIQEHQAKMELLDSLKDKQKLIEKNFPVEKEYAVDHMGKMTFWYAYRLRGFSLGCQPKDFVAQDESIGNFGGVAYHRPLTKKELDEFELDLYRVDDRTKTVEWIKE
jgi:hypothetical protein